MSRYDHIVIVAAALLVGAAWPVAAQTVPSPSAGGPPSISDQDDYYNDMDDQTIGDENGQPPQLAAQPGDAGAVSRPRKERDVPEDVIKAHKAVRSICRDQIASKTLSREDQKTAVKSCIKETLRPYRRACVQDARANGLTRQSDGFRETVSACLFRGYAANPKNPPANSL
jgi:hypothetical protein